MRRFIVGFFALIGFLAFLPIVALIFSLYRWSAPTLPFLNQDDPYVLSLTLGDESLREHTPRGGVASLIEGSTQSVHTLIEGINHAAKDDHIKGLLLTFEGNVLKQATAQEIRDALKAFKASGKFIYTYAHSFGELSNGTMNYYLAALSSKIWMMPLGTLNFNGIMIEVPFAKKALDDLKIHTQLGHREEYKGMIESLTQTDFSPPYRENMQRIISALTAQIIKDVAVGRGLEVDEVQKILNNSPYTPKEAIDHKMIDEIGYKDEVKEAIQKLLGKKPTYRDFDSYSQSMKSPSGKDKIAIVYAEGSISKGKATRSPLSDELVLDAPEIAKALREAREDDSVKAIVLRIDSPGGNPIASELIGREMELTKPKKPVIVSMSNYAASGGYWIACNARKIVAQPGTITGSIGFYAGKIVTQELWDSLGIHWGEIHEGNQAGIWSSGHLYSDAEQEKFNAYLDQIYNIFQEKVANGRHLSRDKVHQIAKGQVWTGMEALDHGLIDALGGLTTAIEMAKKEANLPADVPVALTHLPAPKSFMEMLVNRDHDGDEAGVLTRYPSVRLLLQRFDNLFAPAQVEVKMETLKVK